MKVYADYSFIVALYLQQESSPAAISFLQKQGEPLPFTPWHRVEVRNAIRLAVFHQAIDASQAGIQLKQVDADLRDESLIIHTPLNWLDIVRETEKLGAAHNETIGCRSGDLLHIAAALEWGADLFLTFDKRQQKMAGAAGLAIKS